MSSSMTKYQCMVVCKKKHRNQMCMYEISEHEKCEEGKPVDDHDENKDQIDMVYYTNLRKENSKVEISKDF